jgi:hypothetical protein
MSAHTRALTRKDCEDQLPPDTDPLVVSMHVAATTAERAASRRAAVIAAVTDWLGTDSPPALIAAALSAELGGIGGRMGFGVDGSVSTARMRWATSCGKGRRFATDGAAWDAAMEDVLHEQRADVSPEWLTLLAARCDSSDIAWPLAYCLRQAYMCRDTQPVAAGWAAAARTIASQCEPDTDAGRLAGRYDLPTRRLMLTGRIHVYWGDDVDGSYGAALYLVEEVVEDFLGIPLWEVPGDWQGQEWSLNDGMDTALAIRRDDGCFRVTIRSRMVGHPSCIAAVRAAWVHRIPLWGESEIIAAHEVLAETHADVLRDMRSKWDRDVDQEDGGA